MRRSRQSLCPPHQLDKQARSASNGGAYSVQPPQTPTQKGPFGIRYDFNDGARLFLPPGQWKARITDADSGSILFDCTSEGGLILSTKKYYVNFALSVWKQGEDKPCFTHTLDLNNKNVLISYPVGTLGDLIGWVPYAGRFLEEHACRLTCSMAQNIIDLFNERYPDIRFTTPEKIHPEDYYATYRIGLYFGGNQSHQPYDFRQVGVHRTAGHILGIDPEEIVPDFFIGLGSGLSWLAWGCHIPVILISGFSLPICEFKTPYRVINTHGCYGCWDDLNENFDHKDFFWCPRHKGTERQFECTRLITGQQRLHWR